MMNKVLAIFSLFILTTQLAGAGLPPTTSKISGDATDIVTFKYQFPNFSGTHTGSTLSLGVLSIAGGGSGSATAAGAPWVQKIGDTMSGILDMGSNKITSLTNPTANQDAATKSYVDSQLLQLNPAASVYAASTANIVGTYSNAVSGNCIGDTFTITATGALSLDGASPPLGSRVLLKDQTSSFQDGAWVVTVVGALGVSPVLTRALDFDSSSDINAGQIIPVINGTQAGASWFQTATVATCNSDAQNWTQFQKASSSYASSTLTNTHLFVGNGSNVATDVAMSGDVTLANTGAVTLATVNANVGSFTNASITVNAKGLITAASSGTSSGSLTAVTKTTNYSLLTTDTVILGDSSAGAITFTLPTAVGNNGLRYYIKKIDSTSNSVTIATTSSQTIDGELNQTLNISMSSVILISDGTNWYVF